MPSQQENLAAAIQNYANHLRGGVGSNLNADTLTNAATALGVDAQRAEAVLRLAGAALNANPAGDRAADSLSMARSLRPVEGTAPTPDQLRSATSALGIRYLAVNGLIPNQQQNVRDRDSQWVAAGTGLPPTGDNSVDTLRARVATAGRALEGFINNTDNGLPGTARNALTNNAQVRADIIVGIANNPNREALIDGLRRATTQETSLTALGAILQPAERFQSTRTALGIRAGVGEMTPTQLVDAINARLPAGDANRIVGENRTRLISALTDQPGNAQHNQRASASRNTLNELIGRIGATPNDNQRRDMLDALLAAPAINNITDATHRTGLRTRINAILDALPARMTAIPGLNSEDIQLTSADGVEAPTGLPRGQLAQAQGGGMGRGGDGRTGGGPGGQPDFTG